MHGPYQFVTLMEGTHYSFLGIQKFLSCLSLWCVFSTVCVNQVPTIHRILASLVEVGNLLAFEILEPIKVELAVLPAKTTAEKMKTTTSKKRRRFLRRALTRVTPEGTIDKWRPPSYTPLASSAFGNDLQYINHVTQILTLLSCITALVKLLRHPACNLNPLSGGCRGCKWPQIGENVITK